ncbi:putative laminarinase [Obba rivulosa]|uniref:Putative laminarinase n=1 Tax=Obba rivulosa TaxID=1052685 RepID=A0A8E2AU11_9APHY|nr:putative laminarinase [Obba rivulosa]
MRSSFASATVLALVSRTLAATYSLNQNYVGTDFLSAWTHQAIADPTNGRVNYVDQATALSLNLTYANGDTLVMRADDTTVLSASGPGRNSVRIMSNAAFTHHVAVFDIRHMPQGCATWPAAWETAISNWPNGGEVDIVSVNDETPDSITLHTGAGCTMPASGSTMLGTVTSTDCNANDDGNAGCGVRAPSENSYGPLFNTQGGGFYSMERTSDFIKVWFWSRSDGSVPSDLSTGASSVDTDNWGTPTALFPNTQCDIDEEFSENNIIINLTLCGDWAGQAAIFNGAGCPGDCVDYVNNNPSDFSNAYWDIAAVRVYV